MDIEASVVKRLQKLREWQFEQQERLFKQQQMQRDMLTQRQDNIYKALELSIQELDLSNDTEGISHFNENILSSKSNSKSFLMLNDKSQIADDGIQVLSDKESCIQESINNFGNITPQELSSIEGSIANVICIEDKVETQPKRNVKSDIENETDFTITSSKVQQQREMLIADGMIPDKAKTTHTCIDDIPISSPKKDFHTLLEERLKEYETQYSEKSHMVLEQKVKKPFLRKGEGLSRFKFNQQTQMSNLKMRLHCASLNNSPQFDSRYSQNEKKTNKTARPSKASQFVKGTHGKNVVQKQLCLKKVPLPKKKAHNKSNSNTSTSHGETNINRSKTVAKLNTSDFHSGTQKELEEVRIFELLEEKAENSSFCSTSSAVVAFLQQSTPFQMKKTGCRAENGVMNIIKTTPTSKTPKTQSILKSNTMKQETIENNAYKNIIVKKMNETDMAQISGNNHALLRNQVYNQQKFCNIVDAENDSETDISIHVRFSECNEYKTIGLTDTSTLSTESIPMTISENENICFDCSTSETSTIDSSSIPAEIPQSSIKSNEKLQNMIHSSHFPQCSIQTELKHRGQSYENISPNNDSNYDTETNEHIHYKDEFEFSDATCQSSEEEDSTLHSFRQDVITSQKVENSNTEVLKEHIERSESSKVNKYVSSSYHEIENGKQENKENIDKSNETVFKSELLKNRLLELEQEINIFRKENAALALQRKKLQDDYKNLHKEYTEKQKKLEENRKQAEDHIQEERKKLAREKAALENRMRDSQERAQQSKMERQEMHILREEIEKLKEEMHTKESRWNAAHSRHKCQMRILKMENSKLKQEIEGLQSLKKCNIKNKGKFGSSTNTKSIHQINKQLNMHFKESQKGNNASSDDDNKLGTLLMKEVNTATYQNTEEGKEHSYSANKNPIDKAQKASTVIDTTKKRNLYKDLIREATVDLTDNHEESIKIFENTKELKPNLSSPCKKLGSRATIMTKDYETLYKKSDVPTTYSNVNDNIQLHLQNDYIYTVSSTKACEGKHETNSASTTQDDVPDVHLEAIPLPDHSNVALDKQGIKQFRQADGSIEYQFPNGNIKKVFPDQGTERLIYYNGDIRETNKDGKIKYFYASTRTWHTTMPNGLEILEFADGQIERRSQSGTVEVSFPDGSVRILESDGIERWSLPDGTLIRVLTNGEKILTLPNGQREIHTRTHKRREYPDGTIKLIYLDGTQETRYSNGRIRLKDKDGNLLMDSYL